MRLLEKQTTYIQPIKFGVHNVEFIDLLLACGDKTEQEDTQWKQR